MTDVKLPSFKLICSSHTQKWHGLLVAGLHLAPQEEPVPGPVSDGHLIVFPFGSSGDLVAIAEGRRFRSVARPGDIVLQPMGMDVVYGWNSWASVCHVHIAPGLITAAAAEIGRYDPTRVELLWRFNTHEAFVEQIGLALLNELNTPSPFGRLYAESLAQTLALHLLRHHSTLASPRKAPTDGLARYQLLRVLDYIHAHLADDISLDTLASLADLTPAYFSRQFKASIGVPPYQYVIESRVERARLLLHQSELTVTEIAHLVGFTDHSHLARHFKRIYGFSPSAMRRERKNVHTPDKNVQAETPGDQTE